MRTFSLFILIPATLLLIAIALLDLVKVWTGREAVIQQILIDNPSRLYL